MKRLWAILICGLCVGLAVLPARAAPMYEVYADQLAASGAANLVEQLPADAQELLAQLELDSFRPQSFIGLRFEQILEGLLDLLSARMAGPAQALTTLVGVVALAALFSHLESTVESVSLRQTYHGVAVLAAGGALLTPLASLLENIRQTVDSVTVFMAGYVPVYGAVLAASGSMAGAVSYQTTLLAAAELLTWFIRSGVLPVLVVSLAMGCTGAVADGFCLESVSKTLHKTILWTLGLFSTVFSFVLSLQQMVAASGDSLGGRAMKFSLSTFVPVVGGLLSEAYSTVVGCAGLLRSTVGCFGLVTTVLILLPPFVSCICWNVCLHLAGSAAALFRLPSLEKLCQTAAGTMTVLLAVLAVFALLMVVSTTVIVFAERA